MGLDSAEIVMEIEDTFGIEFTDDDWASMSEFREMTAGNLCEVVQQKLHLKDVGRVDIQLNLNLWNEMRTLLHSVTGVPESRIRLSTELQTLFPRPDRPRWWEKMREQSRLRIRELDFPGALKQLLGWSLFLFGGVVPLSLLIVLAFTSATFMMSLLPILIPCWLIALGYIYEAILNRLPDQRRDFPGQMRSVKDLCQSVLSYNYTVLCDEVAIVPRPREADVWPRIRKILSKQLSIPLDEIKPQSRLIQDLKMD